MSKEHICAKIGRSVKKGALIACLAEESAIESVLRY